MGSYDEIVCAQAYNPAELCTIVINNALLIAQEFIFLTSLFHKQVYYGHKFVNIKVLDYIGV